MEKRLLPLLALAPDAQKRTPGAAFRSGTMNDSRGAKDLKGVADSSMERAFLLKELIEQMPHSDESPTFMKMLPHRPRREAGRPPETLLNPFPDHVHTVGAERLSALRMLPHRLSKTAQPGFLQTLGGQNAGQATQVIVGRRDALADGGSAGEPGVRQPANSTSHFASSRRAPSRPRTSAGLKSALDVLDAISPRRAVQQTFASRAHDAPHIERANALQMMLEAQPKAERERAKAPSNASAANSSPRVLPKAGAALVRAPYPASKELAAPKAPTFMQRRPGQSEDQRRQQQGAPRNRSPDLPAGFTRLRNPRSNHRDAGLLGRLEEIGRTYGPPLDDHARRTGEVWERGGVVGLYNGQVVVSPAYRTDRPGGIDLAGIARRLVREYPGFEPLYDYHLHTSAGLQLGNASVEYGFSLDDQYKTSTARNGFPSFRGSFLVLPDRVLFMTPEEAFEARRRGYAYEGAVVRRWRSGDDSQRR